MKPFFSRPLFAAFLASGSIHLVAVLVPGLQPVFKTFPLTSTEWLELLGLSIAIIPIVELAKVGMRMFAPVENSPA